MGLLRLLLRIHIHHLFLVEEVLLDPHVVEPVAEVVVEALQAGDGAEGEVAEAQLDSRPDVRGEPGQAAAQIGQGHVHVAAEGFLMQGRGHVQALATHHVAAGVEPSGEVSQDVV